MMNAADARINNTGDGGEDVCQDAHEQLSYMKCVFDTFVGLANGTVVKADEVFDNLPAIIGRKPKTLADFARKHADQFRY